MMNRRGMIRAHSHWRPTAPAAQDPAAVTETMTGQDSDVIERLALEEPPVDDELRVDDDPRDEPQPLEQSGRRPRRWPIAAVLLAIAFGAYALGSRPSPTPAPASTGTPRAWLHTYMTASTRSPGRVCSQLLTPTLAQLFARTAGSCEAAYRGVKSSPFTVLRVLEHGGTAAIELHWLPNVGYSTIVLSRDAGGWRAVDMVPGGHVVPHQ